MCNMFVLVGAVVALSLPSVQATAGLSSRPVVGIFSAPLHHSSTEPQCSKIGDCNYVAASYVKWLEHGGAEAVPIPFDSTNSELDALFPQLNGVLFPGGGANLPAGAEYLFNLALAANDNGTYFPVWGTCLGFEWLVQLVGGSDALQSGFDSENISLALNLTESAATSRVLGPISSVPGHRDKSADAASGLRNDISNPANPPTMNNHQSGIEPTAFAKNDKLPKFYDVVATNVDRKGRAFVSMMEGQKYPVYGTQYHPEKNNFEWGLCESGAPYEAINHSPEAVYVSQSLANFFVGECRRNAHTRDLSDNNSRLFWDFAVSQVMAPEFEQVYLLPIKKEDS